ncbi:MAG TPA: 2-hydroxy-3-oxopropionate reductase [Ruminococcaceae bacterium]|jgi:2-hydroxy-3-oxopropionate reductase|nr:2-hydroxy-3-oxopropionate reductase [Oscillospiraceae bacterium]
MFKVGFIGLGIMGKPMARNVRKAGYGLIVYDRNASTLEAFRKEGTEIAANGREVAEKSDVVITMLPNSPHVASALFDKDGIAEELRAGQAVIDMSSINPVASKEFYSRLKERKVDFLDAPVSGGEPGAIEGTIAVMVGGDKPVFDKYYDLLMTMASSVTYIGPAGCGNITKLANQMIVAVNIFVLSEAYVFAKKAGADPKLVFEAIRKGLAGSKVMEQKSPKIFSGDYDPGFRVELHIKDLQNVLDTAHTDNISVPFSAAAMEILQSLKADGLEKKDHSAIVKYFEKINNAKVIG